MKMYGLHVLAFLFLFSTDSNQHLFKLPSNSGSRINSVERKQDCRIAVEAMELHIFYRILYHVCV
jgi:hypothetical protein